MSELAYIVQLAMPGGPIKIGQSCRVRQRIQHFSAGTPVEARLLCVMPFGIQREHEMLEATKTSIIKGEWRYATADLFHLLRTYLDAGDIFVLSANPKKHFTETGVAERANVADPRWAPYGYGYWNAHNVAHKVRESDPLLLLDWHGFERATAMPDFNWHSVNRRAA